MKKAIYLLSALLMMMFYTCSMEEGLMPDPAGDEVLKASCGAVITLCPSDDGDDTDELFAAFEAAKAAGKGSTVKLANGTFTIGFLEIHDFNGYFRGSGKSGTTITNKEELPCGEQYDNNVIASLVKFIGGKVNMADMTFRIKDGRPCAFSESNDINMGDLFSILLIADYNDNYVPADRDMNFMIKNVDFIGGVDDGYGTLGTTHNTGIGIWCGPDFWWPLWNEPFGNGSYTIANCKFTFFLDGVEGFGLGHDAIMRITSNYFDRSWKQLFFTANSGARVFVTNNNFKEGIISDVDIEDTWTDFIFPAVVPDYRTEYHVSGNVFDTPEGVTSLYIHDDMRVQTLNDNFSMLFKVTKNVFKTRDLGTAIFCENNMDAAIWNNTFNGTGSYGIAVNGDSDAGVYATSINILNNNFRGTNYTDATVYLGPFTQDCKVVGVSTDQVIDEGVNNKVIGTKAHKGGPHAKIMPAPIQVPMEMRMKKFRQ